MERKIILNIGCGYSRIDKAINIDKNPRCHPDVIANIVELELRATSADEIYCSHVLEHFDKEAAKLLLIKFYRWLVPGGVLYISVPDVQMLCELIYKNNMDDRLVGFLLGLNIDEYRHLYGYTKDTLVQTVENSGFEYCGEFTPFVQSKDKLNKYFDTDGLDFSAAKYEGIPLSINAIFRRKICL